ncbi:uncharacterized protein [Amphiura filiformis]|uniref:uncharacterized protein n=1 Tax=Amphiura filiformis TaxID=82378 RepID=UPI003B2107BC
MAQTVVYMSLCLLLLVCGSSMVKAQGVCGNASPITIGINESYVVEYLNYGSDDLCEWTINTLEGRHMSVHFDILGLEYYYDFLLLGTLDNINFYGGYTGFYSSIPDRIIGDVLKITFDSDSSGNYIGFNMTLSDVQPVGMYVLLSCRAYLSRRGVRGGALHYFLGLQHNNTPRTLRLTGT